MIELDKKFSSVYVLFLYLSLMFVCCHQSDKQRREGPPNKAELKALSVHTALPTTIKSPKTNPSTSAKINLGRLLFFDPILSGGRDVACATCHHPNNGYAEYRDMSIGVNGKGFGSKRTFNEPNTIPFVKRNAHTILNTAYNGINTANQYVPENAPMFWDLRVLSLENQAIEPIKALEEMRGLYYSETEIIPEVIGRLQAIPEYQTLFEEAFAERDPINGSNLGKAIAAFERTLVTNNSRFDRYMRGEEDAISISEKDGYALFKKVGCANCHNGPMFSDYKPHILGVPTNRKLTNFDQGFKDQYAFRTATLRNLRFTAPYMHNGSLPNLQRVLEFYEDISMNKKRHPEVGKEEYDPLVHELNLRVRDMAPIISFLNTLNDNQFDKTIPTKVPSGLAVGGNIE